MGAVFDRIFHAEALALDNNGIDMVQDAIEDSGGQGAVVVEYLWPVLIGTICGEDGGGALVTLADDLEHDVRAKLIDRKIPELVHDQDGWLDVAEDVTLELAGGPGGGEGIDDVDRGCKEHRMSGEAGGAPERDGQMRLAEADIADHHDVGPGGDEVQAKQVLYLQAVDLFWPAPLEIIEGFDDREARIDEPALGASRVPPGKLAVDELGQIVDVGPLLLGGLACQGVIVLVDVLQAHALQLRVQLCLISLRHHRSPCSR